MNDVKLIICLRCLFCNLIHISVSAQVNECACKVMMGKHGLYDSEDHREQLLCLERGLQVFNVLLLHNYHVLALIAFLLSLL